jgi:glutamate-1-semialdehyde 2,1-aminomutase
VLVEPMANRLGLVHARDAFLAEARALCDRFGIVLVFDEVISFRVGYSGVQGGWACAPTSRRSARSSAAASPSAQSRGRADILDLSSPERGGPRDARGHVQRQSHHVDRRAA